MSSRVGASLPSWERGLKFSNTKKIIEDAKSLPSWERGLKSLHYKETIIELVVAPLVGAWIEI